MRRLRSPLAAVILGALIAATAWAQFSDVRQLFFRRGSEYVFQDVAGETPDSCRSFSIDLDGGVRSVAWYYRCNRVSALGGKTCSLAVAQVSMNDTDYFDASGITGITVNDNLTGFCVSDSCNNYDRYIEMISAGNARLRWRFARSLVYWKVAQSGGVAQSQKDSVRIRSTVQMD